VANSSTLAKLTALSGDSNLNQEQRTILDRYLQATIDTVAYAGANPGKVRMLQHKHCPMHAFQFSHDGKICTGGQNPYPKKDEKKEDKKDDKKVDKKASA
jgi:hypothetical protein